MYNVTAAGIPRFAEMAIWSWMKKWMWLFVIGPLGHTLISTGLSEEVLTSHSYEQKISLPKG